MNKNFSLHLAAIRKEYGLSQKVAANELGISQALLSHYEKGIRECSLDFLVRVAKFYYVTTDYLLGISDVKTPLPPYVVEKEEPNNRSISTEFLLRSTIYLLNKVHNQGDELLDRRVRSCLLMQLYACLMAVADLSTLAHPDQRPSQTYAAIQAFTASMDTELFLTPYKISMEDDDDNKAFTALVAKAKMLLEEQLNDLLVSYQKTEHTRE